MERFQRIYKQGVVDLFEIWVDTETDEEEKPQPPERREK